MKNDPNALTGPRRGVQIAPVVGNSGPKVPASVIKNLTAACIAEGLKIGFTINNDATEIKVRRKKVNAFTELEPKTHSILYAGTAEEPIITFRPPLAGALELAASGLILSGVTHDLPPIMFKTR